MNKIIEWFAPKKTVYVWHDANKEQPTEEGMYLVIRKNLGKLGSAHFDLYCVDQGWMQILGANVGTVVLWTEAPETPEQVKI